MSNPEEIRRDIERTRAELSENVNALGDSTSPGNIARGQVDKVKEGAASLKERVFGSAEDPYDDGVAGDARATMGDAREAAQGAVSNARDAVADTPAKVRSGTRGNPLAAGLIAMGIGALVGGLIPATRKEHEMADQLKDAAKPLADEVKQMATEAKDNLQPVAEEAAHAVGDVAKDAGEHVKHDATKAADRVTDSARESADTVKADASSAVDETKQDAQQGPGRQGLESPDRRGGQSPY